jgi:hypothetical protein
MNLFRSEEHVARWLEANGYEPGAMLTATAIFDLEQNQAILDCLGLSGPFWRLA